MRDKAIYLVVFLLLAGFLGSSLMFQRSNDQVLELSHALDVSSQKVAALQHRVLELEQRITGLEKGLVKLEPKQEWKFSQLSEGKSGAPHNQ